MSAFEVATAKVLSTFSWASSSTTGRGDDSDSYMSRDRQRNHVQQGPEKPLQAERVYRERVLLNVYDLGKTFLTRAVNQVAKSYGAFHTGVEVYGREWSFGMTFDDWSTGVTWNPPRDNPDHRYRETIVMGYTTLSPGKVWVLLEGLKLSWKGCTYNVLTRNCHHFSDTLSDKLGTGHLPEWLNALATTGASTVEYVESADSGYDNGEAITDFFASARKSMASFFGGGPVEDERAGVMIGAASRQETVPGGGARVRIQSPEDSRRGLQREGLMFSPESLQPNSSQAQLDRPPAAAYPRRVSGELPPGRRPQPVPEADEIHNHFPAPRGSSRR